MTGFWLPTKRLQIGLVQTIPYDSPVHKEIIGWLNDPNIVRYSEQRHHKHTIATQTEYVDSLGEDDLYLSINQDKIMIGTMSVHVDKHNSVANVGIMIGDPSKWGHGYGFEAWKAVCDRLLGTYRKVEAGCMVCNLGMMGVCSHYGMMEEGIREDHFIYNGHPIDLIHWGKIK